MKRAIRAIAVSTLAIAASLVVHADVTVPSQAAEVQLQLGNEFFAEARYNDAVDAYTRALRSPQLSNKRAARAGLIQSALRIAEFDVARSESETLVRESPSDPDALALNGDALWASGLFQEAEGRYQEALTLRPELPRGIHGVARSLAARSRLDEALVEAQRAASLSPRDLEVHHTIGAILERMHKFEEAAVAFSNYVNLLPNRDRSEKADWSRAEIKFLRSFGQRVPFEMDPAAENTVYAVEFRTVNEKVVVRAKVNGGSFQDFVVDTGAEKTVLTRPTAQRLGVAPITYTLSAGVGDTGLRGLELARIDSLELGELKLRNVPCLIKDPPLRDVPIKETESLSPLSLGFSMTIDYKTHMITFGKHLPQEAADYELPLRMHRLATVRGTVDGKHPTDFVVDTGGEVISISSETANSLDRPTPTRKISLRVFGSSGWDREAFLMMGVDLAFDRIKYTNVPVVVMNLGTPSALLGFKLGGTVGHKFLSKYRVGFDLERSVLRLKQIS